MKKFLSSSFITLVLLVGALGTHVPVAHADCIENPGEPGVCYDVGGTGEVCKCPASTGTTPTPADKAAASTPVTLPPTPDVGKGLNGIMGYVVQLFAWLLGVAALILDAAVYTTVVTMGNYVSHLTAVGVTWRILRDIGNILLIFGFLAVGITTILDVDWYGGGKKMLPMMFVAAIFLNFSLFIAEAVVDTGNLFATQFYTQINGGQPAGQKTTLDFSSVGNEAISNKIMSSIGLQTIYGQAKSGSLVLDNYWTIGFMSIILFIVAAFVFFSLAFILIARFVALVFLIIVAPIGFAGLAIPGFAARAKDWWTQLFHQTIVAPILLLMLYIAIAVITDVSFLTGISGCTAGSSGLGGCATPSYTGLVNNNFNGFAAVLLSFCVAMGLLFAVVVYAKRWSAFGGDWATKMGAKLSFGLTSYGMRSTFGAGSQLASQAIRRSRFKSTKFGRVVAATFDKGAKGSFDIRGSGVFGAIPFGKSVDVGKAQEGGYRKAQEDSVKKHEEYIKSVEKTIEDKNTGNVIAAQKKRGEAEKNKEAAQREVLAANSDEVKKKKAEIARLEKEVADNKSSGKTGFAAYAAIEALTIAKAKAAPDLEKLDKATDNLTKATEALTDAENGEKKTGRDIAEEKNSAKIAYAKNIQGPFGIGNSIPGMAMFGSGGALAARNMIKEATKKETDAQKALKTLEKAIKDSSAAESTTKPVSAAVPKDDGATDTH